MSLARRLLSEFLGTGGLLMVVVGSGIMGESLAQGNFAIALLANSLATGAGLYALIQTFGPTSGAHFNPAVTFAEWLWRRISLRDAGLYALAQILGAILGVWCTHVMFGQAVLQLSTHDRGEWRFVFSELIATIGLVLVIALSGRKRIEVTPTAVALYITSAYWCTSSTSFANPAVTIARSFTNTFSGIFWMGAWSFIATQLIGAGCAVVLANYLTEEGEWVG